MAEIGTAYVRIEPTAEGISGKLSGIMDGESAKAGLSAGKKFGGSMGSALSTSLKTGVVAMTGIATAAVGVGSAFVASADSVASYGDDIDKMSQKMGLTSEAYQEWDAVMQHSGTSMETMKASMKTLANAVETGNVAFTELGITEEQLATMNQQEIFEATISGLQNVEDDTQRTYLAGKLLGRGATELGALLNTSAEDTQAMRDRVHELGGVMSDEAVKSSAAFKDSLQDLQTSFAGVKNSVVSEMLPSFTSVMDGFSSLIIGEEGAQEKITMGLDGIVQNITQALPKLLDGFGVIAQSLMEVAPELISTLAQGILDAIPNLLPSLIELMGSIGTELINLLPQILEVGLQIILELANGIANSLPELIPTIVDTVLLIVDTLIDNIDLLIDASIAIILGLANGLIESMPKLIERLPEIVIKIVSALIENAPKLLEAAIELILALANGLIEYLPELLAKVPEIIKGIVDSLIAGVSDIKEAGKDIVEGLWKGIKENWESLTTNVKSLGRKLVKAVKDFFMIGSPSKLFEKEIGQWIPKGVAVGIEDNTNSITKAVDNMVDASLSGEVSTINKSAMAGSYMPVSSGDISERSMTTTINVYASEGMNVKELAEVVANKINQQTYRIGVAYA